MKINQNTPNPWPIWFDIWLGLMASCYWLITWKPGPFSFFLLHYRMNGNFEPLTCNSSVEQTKWYHVKWKFFNFLWPIPTLKGQLNSEWIYEVIVPPKMPTKSFPDVCPERVGQKSGIFLVGILGETMTS